MKNDERIKGILTSRGFSKLKSRDTWIRGSWSVRIYKDDIEIYDHPDKSRKYYLGNINSIDINAILDEIE
jgi:hypothetical protein